MPTQHGACCTSRDDAGLVVDPRRCGDQAQHALRVIELQLVQADPVREHIGDGRADLKGHICDLIVLDRRQELQESQTLSNTGGASSHAKLGSVGRHSTCKPMLLGCRLAVAITCAFRSGIFVTVAKSCWQLYEVNILSLTPSG